MIRGHGNSEIVSLVLKFKQSTDLVLSVINEFPQEKRETILFGHWSLKEIIAHLNNWMENDLLCLNQFLSGNIPVWEPDIDTFNHHGVSKRKSQNWQQTYQEFVDLSNNLITFYKTMPKELFYKPIWPNKGMTPEKNIQEDINHFRQHLKDINIVIQKLSK